MNDDDVITLVREQRDMVHSVTPVEQIISRGRARRRRRLKNITRMSVGGVAAATALALGVSGAFSPAAKLGTLRATAFTLRHNHNGTDTLTLNPGELFDAAQLQSDLAQYGIPAKVTSGSYCTSDPQPAGFSQVVSTYPAGQGDGTPGSGLHPTITIDPSQMPSGTELSFGNFQLTSEQEQADVELIDASSYTCTSTPPTVGPDTPGVALQINGPGPS